MIIIGDLWLLLSFYEVQSIPQLKAVSAANVENSPNELELKSEFAPQATLELGASPPLRIDHPTTNTDGLLSIFGLTLGVSPAIAIFVFMVIVVTVYFVSSSASMRSRKSGKVDETTPLVDCVWASGFGVLGWGDNITWNLGVGGKAEERVSLDFLMIWR
jgi:hypothetical protein